MTKAAELAKLGEVLTNSSKGRTNLIINGDMAINQRGATSGVTSGYFVDRFTLSGCSASAVITSNTPTEFPTAITVSATSGNPIVTQRIESKNVQYLSGKVVTASFFAKNVSNATTLYASLQYAGSADNWSSSTTITEHNLGSLSSDWVKYTASWTVPSGGLNGLALNILCAGSSTFTMGVTGVMLQEGSVATPFEHRSFGEELQLCKRYFHKTGGTAYCNIGTVTNYTTGAMLGPYKHPVEMRSAPAVTKSGDWALLGGDTTVHQTAVSSDSNGKVSEIGFSGGSGGTSGRSATLRFSNDANAYLHWDSEL